MYAGQSPGTAAAADIMVMRVKRNAGECSVFLFSGCLFSLTTKTSPECQIYGPGGSPRVLEPAVTISSLMGGEEGQLVYSGTSGDTACETLPCGLEGSQGSQRTRQATDELQNRVSLI